METVDLVIFHYHLMPGGITTVIRHGVESLVRYSDRVSRIRVVAGRIPKDEPPYAGAEIVRLPDIDYATVLPLGGVLWKERAERFADMLQERFGGDNAVWWVHNYHLGKNPLFTEALLRLAADPRGPRLILQPHDFPEAGRFRNLSLLDRLVSLPLYPQGPRVRYAPINSRDYRMLRDAGIPESSLFLLENPVATPVEKRWTEDRRGLRALLFPLADPLQQTVLYPVRSIRRKNVLEAGMLLRLVDTPLRLVVTLPGVSKPEKEYSSLVESTFNSGLIPGEFGVGARRTDLRPEQLAAACDIVVSSSVQEGFGYLFIQALQWGLPLLARRLETIPDGAGLYDGYPAVFYDGLLCPLESTETSSLLSRYREKLRRIRGLLPDSVEERLDAELSSMLARRAVDFSYLDVPLQVRLLEAAGRPDFRAAFRDLNRDLAGGFAALLNERPPGRRQAVEERFGLSAYAGRVDSLLDSFGLTGPQTPGQSPIEVEQKVRAAFARAEHARLLFD